MSQSDLGLHLAFDTHHRCEPGDLARQPGIMGGVDDGGDILIGARRLFGDAAVGGAPDDDALFVQAVQQGPAASVSGPDVGF